MQSFDRNRKVSKGPASTAQRIAQPTKGIVDNRPQAVLQRKLQQMVSSSPRVIQAKGLGRGLPTQMKDNLEAISGYSLDDVTVHYNSSKPAEVGAHAYAQGSDIYLAPGQEKHLAHEAWHVVQQKQGRVRPTVQLDGGVAVNDNAGLEQEADRMGRHAADINIQSANTLQRKASGSAHVIQRRLLSSAAIENLINSGGATSEETKKIESRVKKTILQNFLRLTKEQQKIVKNEFEKTKPPVDWEMLFNTKRSLTLDEKPLLPQVVDLINVNSGKGPKEHTYTPLVPQLGIPTDKKQFKALEDIIKEAKKTLGEIINGTHDSVIKEVFGEGIYKKGGWLYSDTTYIDKVKDVFKQSLKALTKLVNERKIRIDQGGYRAAVSQGGLTGPNGFEFTPDYLDKYDPKEFRELVVTMIHESTHAINGSDQTIDKIYVDYDNPGFLQAGTLDKIKLAPYYEEVARRVLIPIRSQSNHRDKNDPNAAYPPFTHTGVIDKVLSKNPALDNGAESKNVAGQMITNAWVVASNIHDALVNVKKGFPTNLDENDLKNISKNLGLTIHNRANGSITNLDLALAEDRVVQLARLINKANQVCVPDTVHKDEEIDYTLKELIKILNPTRTSRVTKEIAVIKKLADSISKDRVKHFASSKIAKGL